jgi:hypothetical protein
MDDRITLTSGLEQLAGRAGGALFSIEAGTPEYALNRVLLETGSYYVLGVEPTDLDRDGKEHYIRVQHDREGRHGPQPRPGFDSQEISYSARPSFFSSALIASSSCVSLPAADSPSGRVGGHVHFPRRHLHVGSIGGLHAHPRQTQRRTIDKPHVPRVDDPARRGLAHDRPEFQRR